MKERIPQRIDYHRYTEQGVKLDGIMSKTECDKDLPRLNEAIIDNTGDIHYHLAFDTDVLGNRYVTGQVKAQVVLQCQRCMDDFKLDLKCDISIAFVKNEFEQNQAEDSGYDIFWLETKQLFDPRVLIEDELLLALPQIPMHLESEIGLACDVTVQIIGDKSNLTEESHINTDDTMTGDTMNSAEQNDKENPFAILKQLKNK